MASNNKPNIFEGVPYFDFTATNTTKDDLNKSTKKIAIHFIPGWSDKELKVKIFTEGVTNILSGVYIGDKISSQGGVMVRINGHNTENIINRQREIDNFRLMHSFSIGPILYGSFNNGLCYGYQDGEPLSHAEISHPIISKIIAKKISYMNAKCSTTDKVKKIAYDEFLETAICYYPSNFTDTYKQQIFLSLPPINELKSELSILRSKISTFNCPIVFSHNDLLLANILYDKDSSDVKFIDFEYGGYNYLGYDIGNHFCEFCGLQEVDYSLYPGKDFQLEWLRVYLEEWHIQSGVTSGSVTDAEVYEMYTKVNIFALLSHLFWGIWGVVQASMSHIEFDYLNYAKIRISEYYNRKDEFLSLLIQN